MTLCSRHHLSPFAIPLVVAVVLQMTVTICGAAPLDSEDPGTASADLETRIFQLEQTQQVLLEENRRLTSQIQSLSNPDPTSTSEPLAGRWQIPPAPQSPDVNIAGSLLNSPRSDPSNVFADPGFETADEFPLDQRPRRITAGTNTPKYFAGFDRGFLFRPLDADESPFELKINGQDQIRYSGFSRDEHSFTDNAGNVTPLSNMSSFQIPRGRLIFSGLLFRKELLYNLNIDYNTIGNNQIGFRAYWLAWRFSRALTVYAGQSKVPGGREWLLSFVDTQGVDRSMATTFFRPSLSQGIWATGEPTNGVFYHVMMSNGFNTLGSTTQQLSSLMSFSGSLWCEPMGDFGRGYSDFDWHEDPAIRVGTSLTYAPEQGPQGGSSAPENSPIRLSDGTLITQTGALSPGATLTAFKIGLVSLDFAYKYRGFSISSEFYSQDLFAMQADGPIPHTALYQYGGFAQSGYFVVPQKVEPFVRTSVVTGPYGTGTEYTGGCNWFFLPGKQNLRFTLDAAWLNHCSADQNRTNYQAGQTGILIRSQLQIFF